MITKSGRQRWNTIITLWKSARLHLVRDIFRPTSRPYPVFNLSTWKDKYIRENDSSYHVQLFSWPLASLINRTAQSTTDTEAHSSYRPLHKFSVTVTHWQGDKPAFTSSHVHSQPPICSLVPWLQKYQKVPFPWSSNSPFILIFLQHLLQLYKFSLNNKFFDP